MLNVGGVSLKGFLVATRYFRRKLGKDMKISELTQEQNDILQSLAEEYDFRCRERNLKGVAHTGENKSK